MVEKPLFIRLQNIKVTGDFIPKLVELSNNYFFHLHFIVNYFYFRHVLIPDFSM